MVSLAEKNIIGIENCVQKSFLNKWNILTSLMDFCFNKVTLGICLIEINI